MTELLKKQTEIIRIHRNPTNWQTRITHMTIMNLELSMMGYIYHMCCHKPPKWIRPTKLGVRGEPNAIFNPWVWWDGGWTRSRISSAVAVVTPPKECVYGNHLPLFFDTCKRSRCDTAAKRLVRCSFLFSKNQIIPQRAYKHFNK